MRHQIILETSGQHLALFTTGVTVKCMTGEKKVMLSNSVPVLCTPFLPSFVRFQGYFSALKLSTVVGHRT